MNLGQTSTMPCRCHELDDWRAQRGHLQQRDGQCKPVWVVRVFQQGGQKAAASIVEYIAVAILSLGIGSPIDKRNLPSF